MREPGVFDNSLAPNLRVKIMGVPKIHGNQFSNESMGLRPKPCKLLKKFDQNFILKSCIRTILGLILKFLSHFLQKVSGVRG